MSPRVLLKICWLPVLAVCALHARAILDPRILLFASHPLTSSVTVQQETQRVPWQGKGAQSRSTLPRCGCCVLSGLLHADTPDSFVAVEKDADGDSDLDRTVQEHTEQGAAATECQGRGNTAAGCQRRGSMRLDHAEIFSSGYLLQQEIVFAPCAFESGRQRTVTPRSPKPEAGSGQLGLAGERGPPMNAGGKGPPPACAYAAQRACMLASQAANLSGMHQVHNTWNSSLFLCMHSLEQYAHFRLYMHCCQHCCLCSRVQQMWASAPQAQRQEC